MQAPDTLVPARLVLGPVLLSLGAEVLAWAVGLWGDALTGPWYGRTSMLVLVHLLTVGVLWSAIVGVGWQVLAVLAARAPGPGAQALAGVVNGLHLVGVPLLLVGFAKVPWAVVAAAAVLGLAVLLRAGLVLATVLGPCPPGRAGLRLWIGLAELCLVAGVGLGVWMDLARLGWVMSADPMGLLGRHVLLLFAGGVGGWVVGAGSLLLPMFAVASEPRPVAMVLAALPWFLGVALGRAELWGVGAGLVVLGALALARRALRGGLANRQAQGGLVALAAVVAALFAGRPELAVTAGFVGVALPVLHGVGQRILPFLAWAHLAGARAAPPAEGLVPPRLAGAQVVASAVGALLLGLGPLCGGGAPAARLGAGALLLAAVLHAGAVARAWRRGVAEARRAAAPAWARRAT